MPVKPDTPCSKCGKLLWRGTGSLPNPTCLDCRRANPNYRQPGRRNPIDHTCARCGTPFQSSQPRAKWCSEKCRDRVRKAGRKPAHYTGPYHVQAAHIRAAANADPTTTCWRCGRTLFQVRLDKPRAFWTAGHLVDGQAGGPLAPECSPCNLGAGGRLGNQRLNAKRRRTPLTW